MVQVATIFSLYGNVDLCRVQKRLSARGRIDMASEFSCACGVAVWPNVDPCRFSLAYTIQRPSLGIRGATDEGFQACGDCNEE